MDAPVRRSTSPSQILLWLALGSLLVAFVPLAGLTLGRESEGALWGYFCLAPTMVVLGAIFLVASLIARNREKARRPESTAAAPEEGAPLPPLLSRPGPEGPSRGQRAPRRRCPSCRKLNPRDANFCRDCGAPLGRETRKA